ncbi:MAG: phosphohistidine phosphatase SixA [Candidatus Hydrogenedentes bacterium]|nr:phosphohistidine phosphatase SixA [Candidatus Hydrogenedentota bacterium]
MFLYLMQHGDAVAKDVNPDRPLSEQGRAHVERVARCVAAAGVQIPQVWHSGKTRARETAEILARATGGTVEERDRLRPDDDIRSALKQIAQAKCDVAIAGHLPHLSLLAAELLRAKGGHNPIQFQRGGIVALECAGEEQWRVRWMIVPELLRD